MIEELFRDEGNITNKDGEKVAYVNAAHAWWIKFTNGTVRPATDTELELWQLAQGYKDHFTGACQSYWAAYCAGTGKNIDTFDGVAASSPEEEIKQVRLELQRQVDMLTKELEEKS
jgi:hypothetical protein